MYVNSGARVHQLTNFLPFQGLTKRTERVYNRYVIKRAAAHERKVFQ